MRVIFTCYPYVLYLTIGKDNCFTGESQVFRLKN